MRDRERLAYAVLTASRAIAMNGRLRSSLRRAACCGDAAGYEETEDFVQALKASLGKSRLEDCVVDGAMVLLAQPRVALWPRGEGLGALPDRGHLPRRLGQRTGERRLLSELRFQRLLRAAGSDERLLHLRRAIALLDSPVHPLAVVEAWLDLHGEQGRRIFARAYFSGDTVAAGQDPFAPAADAA